LYNEKFNPQNNRQRNLRNDFDAKYTEFNIDLGFRTVTGEDPRPSELLSVYYQKANKGDNFFHERETF
jgi:hypothetical protein